MQVASEWESVLSGEPLDHFLTSLKSIGYRQCIEVAVNDMRGLAVFGNAGVWFSAGVTPYLNRKHVGNCPFAGYSGAS